MYCTFQRMLLRQKVRNNIAKKLLHVNIVRKSKIIFANTSFYDFQVLTFNVNVGIC